MIDNNTCSDKHTHFLRGVDLVKHALEEYKIHTENWTYPYLHFEDAETSEYYAEYWTTGMDWDTTFFLIENKDCRKPLITPVLFFDNNETSYYKYNKSDFHGLLLAICDKRADHKNQWRLEHVVSYINDISNEETGIIKKQNGLVYRKVSFEHASQKLITFYMNVKIIEELGIRKYERKFCKLCEKETRHFEDECCQHESRNKNE